MIRVRDQLSDWRTWMVIAFLALAAVSVYSFRTSDRQTRIETRSAAAEQADSASQVNQCFTAVKNAPISRGFIASYETIIQNGILSNEASLEAERAGDPLHNVRIQSLVRLRKAQKNADELSVLIEERIPTRMKCVKLANRLQVDPSRYLHGGGRQ